MAIYILPHLVEAKSSKSIPGKEPMNCFFINFIEKVDLTLSHCRTGTVLDEYRIPFVSQITAVAFGGPHLDILFVTTASKNGDRAEQAGHLYQISGLETTGTAGIKVKVQII